MPDTQATPNTDDKISALEALVTKLAHKVDSMVSKTAMRRADSARGDDDDKRDDRADDDDRRDDDDKAKKDAARDTLFGGKKRKDAKRDDAKRDDAEECEEEEEEEEEKEAKGDDDKRDDSRSDDRRDDAEEEEEKKGEPEAMASDDDRRKDRKKADDRRDDKRDDSRSDDRRDDSRSDDRRDDSRSDDRRDDSRADSLIRNLQRELTDLKRSMRRRVMTDDELNNLSERQQDWDRVAQMHGMRASRPLDGERIESYDRRMAKVFQKHSDKWKDTNLSDMPIEVVTKVIAPEIRADSMKAAYKSDPSPGAMQREIIKTDRTGRRISEFVGPVDAANGMFAPFAMPPRRVRSINRQPNQF